VKKKLKKNHVNLKLEIMTNAWRQLSDKIIPWSKQRSFLKKKVTL